MTFQGLQAEAEDPKEQSDRCPSGPGWGGVGGLLWWDGKWIQVESDI